MVPNVDVFKNWWIFDRATVLLGQLNIKWDHFQGTLVQNKSRKR